MKEGSSSKMRRGIYIAVVVLIGLIWGCRSESTDSAESRNERQRHAADPQTAQLLVEAQQAFEDGALNKALVLTDSVMQVSPDLADLHFLRARILSDLQRPDLAEKAYNEVLERDPTYRGAWLNLANAAFRKGSYELALERYRKELGVHSSPRVWVAIGSTYEQQRQPDSARYAYERAIALDSTYASAYLHLGQLYKNTGALDQAVSVSRKGVQLDPDNVDYRYALGSLLVLTANAQDAVPHLEAVLEARPWHYWSAYNLGRAFRQLGRQDMARQYLDRAQRMQDHLEEIEYWQGLAESNPDQFMLWVKLADALRRAGREHEAEQADRVARSHAPHYMIHELEDSAAATAHRFAGSAFVNGEVRVAAERYRALLATAENQPDIWHNLGVIYAASGRVDEARDAWETAVQQEPNHAGSRTLLYQLEQPYVPGGRSGGDRTAAP